MLKELLAILGIVLTILQIINISIDIVNKISNRATNAVVYNKIEIY